MRGYIVPRKHIEYWVYGDLIIIYPKPYSIYVRGTVTGKLFRVEDWRFEGFS